MAIVKCCLTSIFDHTFIFLNFIVEYKIKVIDLEFGDLELISNLVVCGVCGWVWVLVCVGRLGVCRGLGVWGVWVL